MSSSLICAIPKGGSGYDAQVGERGVKLSAASGSASRWPG